MNILARYLKAVRPKRYVVLGVVLRPFCIGHYLHLAEQESVMIDDDENRVTLPDLEKANWWAELLLALSVCRHTYEDFEEILNDVSLLKGEFRTVDRIVEKYLNEQGVNFIPTSEFVVFADYIKEGHTVPLWQFNTPEKTQARKKGPSKHWTAQITEDLAQKTNRTVNEIRNMPMQEAWQAWAIAAENEGLISMADEHETARREEMEKGGYNNLEIEGNWDDIVAAAKKRGDFFNA